MRKAKVKKIVLDTYGSFLGMEKGCFVVRDKHDNTTNYPLFEEEIGEVILKSGNTVSVGALAPRARLMRGKFLFIFYPSYY